MNELQPDESEAIGGGITVSRGTDESDTDDYFQIHRETDRTGEDEIQMSRDEIRELAKLAGFGIVDGLGGQTETDPRS